MWRFHGDPITGYEQVSVRRKPRGFVRHSTSIQKVFRSVSRFEATLDWERIDGWEAVGFNGYVSPRVYRTKHAAAEALVTDRRFWASKEEIAHYV